MLIAGTFNVPNFTILYKLWTPVVVSSDNPLIPSRNCGNFSWTIFVKSPPSSKIIFNGCPSKIKNILIARENPIYTVIHELYITWENNSFFDAPKELFLGFTFPCINWDTSFCNGSCSMILCWKNVAWWPRDLCSQFNQCFDQNCCLKWAFSSGHVTNASFQGHLSPNWLPTWIVIWRQPAILAPFSGFAAPNSFLNDINPGISFSAIVISFRPHSQRLISATL